MQSPLLPPAPQASGEDSARSAADRSLALRTRDLLLAPLIAAGHAALARALALFLDLFEKWQCGTLPPPPAPRPAEAVPQAPRPAPAPKRFAPLAWLMGLLRPSFLDVSFRPDSAPRRAPARALPRHPHAGSPRTPRAASTPPAPARPGAPANAAAPAARAAPPRHARPGQRPGRTLPLHPYRAPVRPRAPRLHPHAKPHARAGPSFAKNSHPAPTQPCGLFITNSDYSAKSR